ncbi:MAG: murein transglycosylase A [Rhodospirillales bacterium]|nr:murein transglycosylase A [Rhodospirillales bacterium]
MVLAGLAACAPASAPPGGGLFSAIPKTDRIALVATSFERLAGWRDDDHAAALVAFRRSCDRIRSWPPDRALGTAKMGGIVADWRPICAAAEAVAPADGARARYFFESRLRPYLATDGGRPEGLFTGYYEAQLKGAWTRHGPYQTPIYTRPPELVRGVSFHARARIDSGALAGRGLELLWASDPVDVFFLHIQGSGRVVMEDGSVVRLGYDGNNGHPYVAVGGVLVARGEIAKDAISMQSIRAWMKANHARAAALMALNPRYIFFRRITDAGPIGAQGAALTPGRSLAVDPKFVALGLPLWLDTRHPVNGVPLRRLVVAQDTGGAIKGALRGDLFWGAGAAAAEAAGQMRESGRYYVLLPKSTKPR